MSRFDPWDAIEAVALNDDSARACARPCARPTSRIPVERVLERRGDSAPRKASACCRSRATISLAVVRAADTSVATDVGDDVTYVVNRNINFTNVCFVTASSAPSSDNAGKRTPTTTGLDDVLGQGRRGGRCAAPPRSACRAASTRTWTPFTTATCCVAIKARAIRRSTSTRSRRWRSCTALAARSMDYRDVPRRCCATRASAAIPGTAAEILDDEVREILSHKKLDVRDVDRDHHHRARGSAFRTHVDAHVRPRRDARRTSRATSTLLRGIQQRDRRLHRVRAAAASSGRTRTSTTTGLVAPHAEGRCATCACTPSCRLMLPRLDRQPADLLGEARPPTGAAHACGRLQRLRRHADGGEHLARGRRRRRRVHVGRGDRAPGPRDGRAPRAAHDALQATAARRRDRSTGATSVAGGWRGRSPVSPGAVRASADPTAGHADVIVNTGDDEEFFGLHVSPDLDTILYTLAGRSDPRTAGASPAIRSPRSRRSGAARARLVPARRPRPGDAPVRTERLRAGGRCPA